MFNRRQGRGADRPVSTRAWLLAAIMLAARAPAAAIPAPPSPEIVVTAPTPLSPGPATTAPWRIDAAELQASHAVDLSDHLRRMAGGVFVNDVQGNPLQPDVNYHGFTASPLLGTAQGLSLYMDGVRLNQPFGEVVSWDLIPRSAIRTIELVPATNPLFGRNALGGTLAIATKDGRSDPGYGGSMTGGSFGRGTLEAQAGGRSAGGFHWFSSMNLFGERGWRDFSRSRAAQGFAKTGWAGETTEIALSGSVAASDLNGNGLQEKRLLDLDRNSIYTAPDNIRNRSAIANLTARHRLSNEIAFSGNAFWRGIRSRTYNGDVNDDALGENVYQPNAVERAALAAAGYGGFPLVGEAQANTPFPKWRCIAEALLNTEPNEKCDGLVNRSSTRQHEWGLAAEASLDLQVAGKASRLVLGASHVRSGSRFGQSSQFGYLLPDRTVVAVDGPGAFADGSQQSENAFDARVALASRTRAFGIYALASTDPTPTLHVDLSARYDRTAVHNRDGVSPGGGTGSLDGDPVYHRVNPAVSLRWTPRTGWSLQLASSRTSRAPSAIELGCADPQSPCRLPNALAGDPPLRQVVARTDQADIRIAQGRATFTLSIFRTDSLHDILFVTSEASGFGYFRNVGTTRRQGIDAGLRFRTRTISVSAHYSFLDATFRDAGTFGGAANSGNDGPAPGFDGDITVVKGDRLPLVPRHVAKASIAWQPARTLSLNADLLASSGTYARGNENNLHQADGIHYLGPGRTAAYAVVNLGAEARLTRALTLFVQTDNVLDSDYANAAQLSRTAFDSGGRFVARPFAGPVIDGERPLQSSTFYAPGAPRAFWIGARVSL